MSIASPYLLYLGSATNPLDIKTSRGLALFRGTDCVGEFRHADCPLTLGLPSLTFAEAVARGARTLVIGIAVSGGQLTGEMIADVRAAIEAGLDVAAGMHQRLSDIVEVAEAAKRHGRRLHDVRVPPAALPIGKGKARRGHRLLTVGTDCAVGKMFTALHLTREMRARGVDATFRATGQTGILIAGDGIPIDAVVADFIAGAAERLSPERTDDGWDVIEGQGSLFNPSFAGVSLGLLHGSQPEALVLCHDPSRPHMRALPHMPVPDLDQCLETTLEAARLTSPDVRAVGVSLNCSAMTAEEGATLRERVTRELGLPCVDPAVTGVGAIVDMLVPCAVD